MQSKDEWPVRAIAAIGNVVSDVVDERIIDHEKSMHRAVPGPSFDDPTVVPFQDEQISDADLARMAEILERGDHDISAVSSSFGYPYSLAERELARYRGSNRRYVRKLL